MNESIDDKLEQVPQAEYKILAKNSIFSFLNSYGTFFLQLIVYFFTARLLNKEEWDLLIVAYSIILIVILIGSFFPPGIENSLNYFIPKFSAIGQTKKLKEYIKYSILSKVLSIIPIFLITLLIFTIFPQLFTIALRGRINLLYIYSPIIIITSIDLVLIAVQQGLNMFNTIFYLLFFRYTFHITALIVCFIFINPTSVELIAYINLFALLIPFLVNCIIVFLKYKSLNVNDTKGPTYSSFLKDTTKYGINLRIGNFLSQIWLEIQTISIAFFATAGTVTGFNISRNYSVISSSITITFLSPLTITFSRLFTKKAHEQIKKIYNIFLTSSLLILLFLTGILYLCTDIFLVIIYGDSYLIYSDILKAFLLTIIFLGIGSPFESYMRSTNNSRWILWYRLIAFILRLPIFLLFLINFGLLWAIISLIFVHLLIALISLILGIKIGNIKVDLKNLILLFIAFGISLGGAIIAEILFLDELNLLVLNALNLTYFSHFNIFSFLLFILLLFGLIYYFRVFSPKNIIYLESLIDGDSKIRIALRRTLKIMKIFARE